MNAEIIAVGSELLTPQRTDTNSLYLTSELNLLGVEVLRKTIIGDDRERLTEAVRSALRRAEILIVTGGLGPTEDDVTRDALAAALQRTQLFRQDLCDGIEARFQRANRVMAEINRRQAFLIEGAEALPNPNGTAPGQWIEDAGRIAAMLPGPPSELKPMFRDHCVPRFRKLLPGHVIRARILRIAGLPESDVDQRISPVYTKYSNPATTILAAAGDIQVHLRARCDAESEAECLLDEVSRQIEAILGERIYSRNGDPLEVVVGDALRRRSESLSVAESCTGGLLAGRITEVPGSSDYFYGGFLVYNNRMKQELLGIDGAMLKTCTAVSEPVAEEMAIAVRERTRSTWGLSITGIAGPGGGTDAVPAGTVLIGVSRSGDTKAYKFHWIGDRERVRTLAVQTALDLLRMQLR